MGAVVTLARISNSLGVQPQVLVVADVPWRHTWSRVRGVLFRSCHSSRSNCGAAGLESALQREHELDRAALGALVGVLVSDELRYARTSLGLNRRALSWPPREGPRQAGVASVYGRFLGAAAVAVLLMGPAGAFELNFCDSLCGKATLLGVPGKGPKSVDYCAVALSDCRERMRELGVTISNYDSILAADWKRHKKEAEVEKECAKKYGRAPPGKSYYSSDGSWIGTATSRSNCYPSTSVVTR